MASAITETVLRDQCSWMMTGLDETSAQPVSSHSHAPGRSVPPRPLLSLVSPCQCWGDTMEDRSSQSPRGLFLRQLLSQYRVVQAWQGPVANLGSGAAVCEAAGRVRGWRWARTMVAAGGKEERDPGIQEGGFHSSVHCWMWKEMPLSTQYLLLQSEWMMVTAVFQPRNKTMLCRHGNRLCT